MHDKEKMEEELEADIRNETHPLTSGRNVLIVVVIIHCYLSAQ